MSEKDQMNSPPKQVTIRPQTNQTHSPPIFPFSLSFSPYLSVSTFPPLFFQEGKGVGVVVARRRGVVCPRGRAIPPNPLSPAPRRPPKTAASWGLSEEGARAPPPALLPDGGGGVDWSGSRRKLDSTDRASPGAGGCRLTSLGVGGAGGTGPAGKKPSSAWHPLPGFFSLFNALHMCLFQFFGVFASLFKDESLGERERGAPSSDITQPCGEVKKGRHGMRGRGPYHPNGGF